MLTLLEKRNAKLGNFLETTSDAFTFFVKSSDL